MEDSHMICGRVVLFLTLSALAPTSQAFEECGELETGGYGPFDYRTATPYQKRLVEGAHFLPYIETLQRGKTGPVAGELDYTLRAFPNHPRALMAMMKLGIKTKSERPYGTSWPISCYFDRAIRFTPDDPAVHTVYGLYLTKKGERQEARRELEIAKEAI